MYLLGLHVLFLLLFSHYHPAGIYLLKVSIKKLRHLKRRSGVCIVNFEHISYSVLVFLVLTLNMQLPTVGVTTLEKVQPFKHGR